ncbi:MAG TPA: restriction endonuclease subunit S [Gammaproteobacteria bacterium]|nr:restriction endonuclease subunit S [Gammaproteobacteria bacterium]HPQ88051.1 restriction endonuclease subunit S [Gammaproteobacteria bacterium]
MNNVTTKPQMKQLVPELRFKEYSESWSHDKLEKFVSLQSGYAFKSNNFAESGKKLVTPKNFTKTGYGLFTKTNTKFTTEVPDEKYICKQNDLLVLLTDLTPSCELLGKPMLVTQNDGELLLNQRIVKVEIDNKLLSKEFVMYLFLTKNYHKRIKSTATGSTVRHSSNDILKSYKFGRPPLKEQQKIANFLTAVDQRIRLLKQKKAALETYKKGLMQKIFSQEIRFKDKNGKDYTDWELVQLSEIINKFIVPMRDKPKDLTGGTPWCRIEDFDGKYLYSSKTNQGVSKKVINAMNLKVIPRNSLIVSCSAYLGKCAIVKNDLITNQTFIGLIPNVKIVNIEFLFYAMQLMERKLNTLSSGTTIAYLSRKEFENLRINIPQLSEQKNIAECLSAIDQSINQLTKQINQTTQFKKGLLQRMFV